MRKPSTLAEYRAAYERVCDKLADALGVMVTHGCNTKYITIRDRKYARKSGKKDRQR